MATLPVTAFLVLLTGVPAGQPGWIASAAGESAPAGTTPAGQSPRPNFIIVFADDQGYGDLGVFGATAFETTRIDSYRERRPVLRGWTALAAARRVARPAGASDQRSGTSGNSSSVSCGWTPSALSVIETSR